MDETKALTIPPREQIAKGREMASALTDVIKKKRKPVVIRGEQYIEFEDWQTLGQFFGYGVKTYDAEPVTLGGVNGFKARAALIELETGMEIGGAEAYCMDDEKDWGSRPSYQRASMAQTRAGAKAFRNRLSWIVVLAGFKSTPAEEMPRDGEEKPKPSAKKPRRQLTETEQQIADLWKKLDMDKEQARADLLEATGKEKLSELDDVEQDTYLVHLMEMDDADDSVPE